MRLFESKHLKMAESEATSSRNPWRFSSQDPIVLLGDAGANRYAIAYRGRSLGLELLSQVMRRDDIPSDWL